MRTCFLSSLYRSDSFTQFVNLRWAHDCAELPTVPDLDEPGADCVPDACSDPGASV